MDVSEGNWDVDDYLGPSIILQTPKFGIILDEKNINLYFSILLKCCCFFLGDKYNLIYTVFLIFEKPEPISYINTLVASTYWAIHS